VHLQRPCANVLRNGAVHITQCSELVRLGADFCQFGLSHAESWPCGMQHSVAIHTLYCSCEAAKVMLHCSTAPKCMSKCEQMYSKCFLTFPPPCGRFDEASYKEFRQHTLEEAAMAAARHASVSKVMVLCERHPHRLVPGMLTLLACLPETVPADSYSQLLTLVSCPCPFKQQPDPLPAVPMSMSINQLDPLSLGPYSGSTDNIVVA